MILVEPFILLLAEARRCSRDAAASTAGVFGAHKFSPLFSHPGTSLPPRRATPLRLPQKPYLPLGSLRAQMLYPHSEDEVMLTTASMEGILEQVQLGYLCSRSGGLGAVRDWQDELSLGEQQVRGWGAVCGERV